MSRSAFGGRALGGRALCSMLLAVGGLVACGPEQGDAALTSSAALAPGPPADVGTCRRWTTCVPENPCHTGWVTGCRRNVPVCTDIGGWLSNGTSCADQAVCFMGECVPCAAGAGCPIPDMYGNPDACRVGAIVCDSGQPVCTDQGPADDGTACGGGGPYVCKDGSCTFCMEGQSCTPPEGRCHTGVWTSCATATCADTGAAQNGSWCDYRAVCRDGDCVACNGGDACTLPDPCWTNGYVDCSSGWPVCTRQWPPSPDGTPCDGGVCQGGACVAPCVPDQPCTPSNACFSGRTVCDGMYQWCQEVAPVPEGTSCGTDAYCVAGSCTPCGSSCQWADSCVWSATVSCATGRCEPVTSAPEGTSCGFAGETCQGGACAEVPGARPIVRSAYGYVDLTGTTWAVCFANEPEAGMSRLKRERFAVGASTHEELIFPLSTDCTGESDPALGITLEAALAPAGDRLVTWAGGMPPPGLPWPMWSVWATAVHITAPTSPFGPIDLKDVAFVNDAVTPRQLFSGEDDYALGPDGYPTLLVGEVPSQEVLACNAGDPCLPGYPTCELFAIDCAGGVPACVGTGTFRPEGATCGDFLRCQANACLPVPTRTVTGTAWTTYWPDAADADGLQTTDPALLYGIASLQVSGASSAYRPGQVFPDGTFAIPDVYELPYLLEMATPTGLSYVHAAAATSTLDLGVDLLGRQDLAWAVTNPTQVLFTVRNLVPWTPGDVVEFASSNAGVAALPFGPQESSLPLPGVLEFTRDFAWYGRPLVDAGAGDVAYVFQASTTTLGTGERVSAASGFSELTDLTLLDGIGGTVDVTLGACPGAGAASVDWRRSEFEAMAAQVHPEAAHGNHRIVVGARPHQSPFAPGFRSGELAQYPGLPLLVAHANAGVPDGALELSYGRFLPPLWREYRHDRHMMSVSFTAPGAVTSARLNAPLGYDVAADAVAGGVGTPFVVTPIVTPPTNLTIEGIDAWSGVSGVGTTPRITWTAPVPSPAAAALFPGASLQYRIVVYEVRPTGDGLGTQLAFLFEAKTTRTTIRLPGASVYPGGRFVVAVTARLTADSIVAPRRTSIEEAYATVVSREFMP